MTLQVFISYKSEYRDFARAVKSELNQWGFNTWLDVDNIQPGDYFRHKIQEGLDSSDVLLMVLTEEAQRSREVMAEVDYFLDVNKPVVPLRHREFKPLYIFVSIQYIDFVTDQANGFVQLKQRLSALAQSTVESTSGAEPEPEPMPEESASEAEVALLDDLLQEKSEHKKEAIEDGLFAAPALPSENAPMPQPVPPPKPITSPITAPAAPPMQEPQRQAEYMPQPASRSKSSGTLLRPLAAVASLIVVVGVAVLLSTNAAIPPLQSTQETSPMIWVGALVLAGVVGAAGYIGWQRFGRSKSRAGVKPSQTEDAQNRATMLQKVEDFWLKGVLDPALEAGTFEMGLSAAPGAVLRHRDYGDYELPTNANILDVFNDLNRELLILGAPGGGKTVLLLQLAKELIQQARSPHPPAPSPTLRGPSAAGRGGVEAPIPVVFNLSSWAAERKPLADWLADELRQKYQVPKKVATAWVEGEKLLLLLDGLDEVAEQYRNECVDAINTYRQKYRTVDLAICSRELDYDSLTSKLDVRGAIVLEALSQPVIDKYLDRPELATLKQLMATDDELQEMSQVPFLLNAMAYAYAGADLSSLREMISANSVKAQRNRLFDEWVAKRLAVHTNIKYMKNYAHQWMSWLAAKMVNFGETTFYIENLQPNRSHVVTGKPLRLHFLISGLIYGLIIGIALGIVGLLAYFVSNPIGCGFALGITSSMAAFLSFGSQEGIKQSLIIKTQIGLSILVIAIVLFLPLLNLNIDWIITSIIGFPIGLLGAWETWGNINNVMRFNQMSLNTTEIISWSFTKTVIGFLFGFVTALFFGVLFGLGMGLIFGLSAGFSSRKAEIRTVPNQGLWQSLKNAFSVILISFLISIISFILFNQIIVGILFGIVLSIILGAVNGGMFVIQHTVLRFLLWHSGDAPWNYIQFLDYCVSVGMMRKVGGGYIFAHRYLMEYFAESYQEEHK